MATYLFAKLAKAAAAAVVLFVGFILASLYGGRHDPDDRLTKQYSQQFLPVLEQSGWYNHADACNVNSVGETRADVRFFEFSDGGRYVNAIDAELVLIDGGWVLDSWSPDNDGSYYEEPAENPAFFAGSTWCCEETGLEFYVPLPTDKAGYYDDGVAYLEDGTKLCWHFYYDRMEIRLIDPEHADIYLLEGTQSTENGICTFTVEQDAYYGGQYEQLHFCRIDNA
ncbi:MAG: hypothetical protein IJC61_02020 [Oscillospiraceae bacterium]|nr:hypothetical protein [Oscillospiraceae bacterium]